MKSFINSQRVKLREFLDQGNRERINPPISLVVVCLLVWVLGMCLAVFF